ncbi:MAG: DUF192 domain-containing protein [Acidobacteria bacterium]|nr:MAG: DUF192 domain-containing protein [Acidobacteriota bacterium]
MPTPVVLINERTRKLVAEHVEVADTRRARRRGLLGRTHLDDGDALMLIPCFTVHTAFMRFTIDLIFLDRDGCVVRTVSRLQPWRTAMAWRAHSVVELPAGRLERCEIETGDRLYLSPLREHQRAS